VGPCGARRKPVARKPAPARRRPGSPRRRRRAPASPPPGSRRPGSRRQRKQRPGRVPPGSPPRRSRQRARPRRIRSRPHACRLGVPPVSNPCKLNCPVWHLATRSPVGAATRPSRNRGMRRDPTSTRGDVASGVDLLRGPGRRTRLDASQRLQELSGIGYANVGKEQTPVNTTLSVRSSSMSRRLGESAKQNLAASETTVILIPIQRLALGNFRGMHREAPGSEAGTVESEVNLEPNNEPNDRLCPEIKCCCRETNPSARSMQASVTTRPVSSAHTIGPPGRHQENTKARILSNSPRAVRSFLKTCNPGFSWRSAGWVP